jgi:hypothetical protein
MGNVFVDNSLQRQLQADQLLRKRSYPIGVTGAPTKVHPHVAAIGPTQVRKNLRERREAKLRLGIVFVVRHEHRRAAVSMGYGKANTEVPLQMQLLESDFIDSYRDGVPPSTIRQLKARDNAALAFDFSLHHLWNDLSRLLHTRLHLPSPNLATRLRLTTALAVRLHRAFAGRPFLKPIAICLQCQGKILANTAMVKIGRRLTTSCIGPLHG